MSASTPTPVAGTAAAPRPGPAPSRRPSCFVVQGFGRKTDYTAGRVLDLDASYAVIREAVRDAGLDCLRCDEVVHAGLIDAPMYEQLMRADLVIADLSTYNINAAFELGVRYGLRPYATIIVAEEGFSQPFDVSHSVIRRYRHLGEDIGAREAARFRAELATAIREIVERTSPDSPVYTFLSQLVPPSERMEQAVDAAAHEVDGATAAPDGAAAQTPPQAPSSCCGSRRSRSSTRRRRARAISRARASCSGSSWRRAPPPTRAARPTRASSSSSRSPPTRPRSRRRCRRCSTPARCCAR